jgi:hypothetical protein
MILRVTCDCTTGKNMNFCQNIDTNIPFRNFRRGVRIYFVLLFAFPGMVSGQEQNLRPESVFREYSNKKMFTPFKGEFAAYDSFQVVLNIDDLKDATNAEVALNFWGGHIGTSDQTFKVNGSQKFEFPQPKTPGSPYCYFRFGHGNPPVTISPSLLKTGENTFTFFCGKQICHGFNWPLYWLNSFTVRVFYNGNAKQYAKGKIRKRKPEDKETAYNLVGFETDVDDPAKVASVEYIGYYEDYDLDGDGKLEAWHYTLNNGEWSNIIGRQSVTPYSQNWNNNWVPEQTGTIKVVAKINSRNGVSYLTPPAVFTQLRQHHSRIKMYRTESLEENFASRVSRRKECNIRIDDKLADAISAYLILSSWSGESEDGAKHSLGINGKMLAESPGKLHDFAFLRIPVPLEYLKTGDNTFYVFSETEEHMFEINYPGPAILIRYAAKDEKK